MRTPLFAFTKMCVNYVIKRGRTAMKRHRLISTDTLKRDGVLRSLAFNRSTCRFVRRSRSPREPKCRKTATQHREVRLTLRSRHLIIQPITNVKLMSCQPRPARRPVREGALQRGPRVRDRRARRGRLQLHQGLPLRDGLAPQGAYLDLPRPVDRPIKLIIQLKSVQR